MEYTDNDMTGGGIFSTFPVELGSWAELSGTSMATPYVSDALVSEAVLDV